MALSITNALAITCCDTVVDAVDSGAGTAKLQIYAGTMPTTADDALSSNPLLATCDMSTPAFGAASDQDPDAMATANAISDDTSADNTDTATFFRIFNRNGTAQGDVVMQGDVTATSGGGQLELNTVSIQAGATVSVTSLTVTMPDGP